MFSPAVTGASSAGLIQAGKNTAAQAGCGLVWIACPTHSQATAPRPARLVHSPGPKQDSIGTTPPVPAAKFGRRRQAAVFMAAVDSMEAAAVAESAGLAAPGVISAARLINQIPVSDLSFCCAPMLGDNRRGISPTWKLESV